ncbi:MAG: metallophosphoesterase [Chitinophagales bacterium]|nr:metallophosphoesterase [Chitinophagales bacterium]
MKPNPIHKALDQAKDNAISVEETLEDLKWIIFSDHHRGRKDRADDFVPCEATYLNALKYYLDKGFTLVLLGDVEEFWENPLPMVMKRYKKVLEYEKRFYDNSRLYKIWGNHDDAWRYKGYLQKHLSLIFPEINVHESITLNITVEGKLKGKFLLIHGHQGTLESDKYAFISKFFVRYIWRNIQRLFRIPLSTPAKDASLKSIHDKTMYSWSEKHEETILICGHTHQPVFMSLTHADRIKNKIRLLKESLREFPNNAAVKNEIELAEQKLRQISEKCTEIQSGESELKPYYFNSGCCSFGDGDITGIQLADNQISLVKWNENADQPIVLEKESIQNLFR